MKTSKDINTNLQDIELGEEKQEISISPIFDLEKSIEEIEKNSEKNIDLRKNVEIKILENNKPVDRIFIRKKSGLQEFFTKIKTHQNINSTFKQKSISIFLILIFAIFSFGNIYKKVIEKNINLGIENIKLFNENNSEIFAKNTEKHFKRASFFLKPLKIFPDEKIKVAYFGTKIGENTGELLQNWNKDYLTNSLSEKEETLKKINSNLIGLNSALKKLNSGNDENLRKLKSFENEIDFVSNFLNISLEDFPAFLEILGHDREKTYVALLQNADEIRANGGFSGSFALIKVYKGNITEIEKKDIYEIEWDLKKFNYEKSPAPEGIDKLTEYFGLRDANYFTNIGDSSKEIRKYFQITGRQIDGVIFINHNILEKFLEKTGEIQVDGNAITAENYASIISILVEGKIYKVGTTGTPKQILFDFIDVFYAKVRNENLYKEMFEIAISEISRREILMHNFKNDQNEILRKIGLSGEINIENTFDFNYPVFTSISGNKSDRFIKRDYKKIVTSSQNSCNINTKLEISLTHTFSDEDYEYLKNELGKYGLYTHEMMFIQGSGQNKSFVRVIIPKNTIVNNRNILIDEYESRRSVNFYMDTERGQTSKFVLDYDLLNPDCKKYNYKFFKQPGIKNYNLEIIDGKNELRGEEIIGDVFYE